MFKKISPFVFFIAFFLIASYYNYFEILQKRPQSIHRWRQTDSGSIALNYYQNGMHFFQPEVLFQVADDRHSGYTVGEFPGFYYFIAVLWKIFGYSDFIYRLVNVLIFFLGLFALYRLLLRLLKDHVWAIILPLVFFTSPVIIYYANNYITDVTAFSLSLIAWNLWFTYYEQGKRRQLVGAFLFFTLAGLLKVIALLSPVALLGVYVSNRFRSGPDKEAFFNFNLKTVFPFITCFTIVGAWYLFAIHYNKVHHSIFFSTQTFPVWNLTSEDIASVWRDISEYWYYDYYHASMFLFFLFAFILSLFAVKKQNKFLIGISSFLFIGVVLFSMLWYAAFGAHDYYIINPMILPVAVVVMFADLVNREWPRFFKSVFTKLALATLLIFNVYYAAGKVDERYSGWVNDYPVYKDVHTVTPYLRSIGIQRTDKVISLPDPTPNYTLYLMNQPGWTQAIEYEMDSAKFYEIVQLGAKYLIITEEEPMSRSYLKPYFRDKIGQYGSISIFKL